MAGKQKKSTMTLDKLARMTANEFSVVRKDMSDGFAAVHKEMATKEDLKHFATKDDLKEMKEGMKEEFRTETAKVLEGVDKILVHFDKAEKDHAADKLLHDRHEKRLETIE